EQIAHADRQPIGARQAEREVALVVGARRPDLAPLAGAAREHVDVLVLERLVDDGVRDPALELLRDAAGRRDQAEAAVARVAQVRDQAAREVTEAAGLACVRSTVAPDVGDLSTRIGRPEPGNPLPSRRNLISPA